MLTSDVLREAEADLKSLATLPGEIRAKVKAGVAELTRLRDAIDATIADMAAEATATLTSLQGLRSSDGAPADGKTDAPPAPSEGPLNG